MDESSIIFRAAPRSRTTTLSELVYQAGMTVVTMAVNPSQ